jgi:hypothetical protein
MRSQALKKNNGGTQNEPKGIPFGFFSEIIAFPPISRSLDRSRSNVPSD